MSRLFRQLEERRREFLDGLGVPEKSEFVPDDFQLAAIDALKAREDTLVIAPTGSGKTYIAIEGMRDVLARGGRCIYTAPLKALSNSKFAELKRVFEPQYRVGLLTGDRKIDGDAHVVVATTEIYRNELYGYSENYGLVVLDELHYLADPQRGPVWEESIILAARSSVLLMLSASISNPIEIAEWIEQVRTRPVRIVTKTVRPVPMRLGFLHPEFGAVPLEDSPGQLSEVVDNFYRGLGFGARAQFPGRPGWGRGRRS